MSPINELYSSNEEIQTKAVPCCVTHPCGTVDHTEAARLTTKDVEGPGTAVDLARVNLMGWVSIVVPMRFGQMSKTVN